jgi:DNA-binding CsgD family transcriptional regulator
MADRGLLLTGSGGDRRAQESRDSSLPPLYRSILSCRAQDDMLSKVLEPIAEQIGAEAYLHFSLERLSPSEISIANQNCSASIDAAVKEYCSHFFELDPLLDPFRPWLGQNPALGAAPLVRCMSDVPRWSEREFNTRFLRRIGIGHVASAGFPLVIGSTPKVFCFGFIRSVDSKPFTALDMKRIEQLGEALQCVLENLALQRSLSLKTSVATALSDGERGVGYVLLDDDFMVRDASHSGLSRLGLVEGAKGSRLFGEVRSRLMRLDERTMDADAVVELCEISSASGNGSILARPLVRKGAVWWLLVTSSGRLGDPLRDFCRATKLSAREADVARLLCAGQSNPGIGKALGISPRTVENHLRSMYGKCKVNSRAAFIARVLGIS